MHLYKIQPEHSRTTWVPVEDSKQRRQQLEDILKAMKCLQRQPTNDTTNSHNTCYFTLGLGMYLDGWLLIDGKPSQYVTSHLAQTQFDHLSTYSTSSISMVLKTGVWVRAKEMETDTLLGLVVRERFRFLKLTKIFFQHFNSHLRLWKLSWNSSFPCD